MRRTMIHAIAAGAVVICSAQSASSAGAGDPGAKPTPTEDAPPPLVAAVPAPTFSPANEAPPAFIWSSDATLMPPPYLTAPVESPLPPPSASATTIPLPAGAWTGLASLAGLGTIAFLRHLRRAR